MLLRNKGVSLLSALIGFVILSFVLVQFSKSFFNVQKTQKNTKIKSDVVLIRNYLKTFFNCTTTQLDPVACSNNQIITTKQSDGRVFTEGTTQGSSIGNYQVRAKCSGSDIFFEAKEKKTNSTWSSLFNGVPYSCDVAPPAPPQLKCIPQGQAVTLIGSKAEFLSKVPNGGYFQLTIDITFSKSDPIYSARNVYLNGNGKKLTTHYHPIFNDFAEGCVENISIRGTDSGLWPDPTKALFARQFKGSFYSSDYTFTHVGVFTQAKTDAAGLFNRITGTSYFEKVTGYLDGGELNYPNYFAGLAYTNTAPVTIKDSSFTVLVNTNNTNGKIFAAGLFLSSGDITLDKTNIRLHLVADNGTNEGAGLVLDTTGKVSVSNSNFDVRTTWGNIINLWGIARSVKGILNVTGTSFYNQANFNLPTSTGSFSGMVGTLGKPSVIDNCTLRNSIVAATSSTVNTCGIIDTTNEALTIKRSEVKGNFTYSMGPGANSTKGKFGGLVCDLKGANSILEDVTYSALISGAKNELSPVGGLIATLTASRTEIRRANINLDPNGLSLRGGTNAGGLIGVLNGVDTKIENCTIATGIASGNNTGGMIGLHQTPGNTTQILTNTLNIHIDGNATPLQNNYLGGVIGNFVSGKANIHNTSVSGRIRGKDYIGGLVGKKDPSATLSRTGSTVTAQREGLGTHIGKYVGDPRID